MNCIIIMYHYSFSILVYTCNSATVIHLALPGAFRIVANRDLHNSDDSIRELLDKWAVKV